MLGPGAGESTCTSPLRAVSQFVMALWVSQMQALLALKAINRFLGAYLSGAGLKSWSTRCGVQTLCSSGRNLGFWVSSQLWVAMLVVGFMSNCVSASACFDVSFFLFTRCGGIIQLDLELFSLEEIILYRAEDWCVCGRRWVQNLPTLSSWTRTPCWVLMWTFDPAEGLIFYTPCNKSWEFWVLILVLPFHVSLS